MKSIKTMVIAICAILLSVNANAAKLNASNGLAAGKSLLALYTQFKADGKLDLSNASNINNIVTLVSNVKGLTSESTASSTPASFVSSLISGSNNLVTKNNSNSVLGALGSIANLDTKSIASSVASSAAKSAIGNLLGKASSSSAASSSQAASTAGSVLSSLFSSLK